MSASQYFDSLTTKGVLMFRKTVIAGITAAALGSGVAQAQQPPASPHTLTGNIGLFSQYIFRGLTQTNGEPATPGRLRLRHESGFYVGTWGSNISWLSDCHLHRRRQPGAGHLRRLQGHHRQDRFRLRRGPALLLVSGRRRRRNGTKADTLEVYGALSWKWLSAKLSYALSNKVFGVPSADGTTYLDLTASYPVPNTKLTLIGHYGMQKYTGNEHGLLHRQATMTAPPTTTGSLG